MSKPTHILRTLQGAYLLDLSDPEDYQKMGEYLGFTGGIVKLTHMVEDESIVERPVTLKQGEARVINRKYIDRVAIVACRALVSLEEL